MAAVGTAQPAPAPGSSGKAGPKGSTVTAPNDVHILLVDDEVLTRKVVGNLLRKCGYRGAGLPRRVAKLLKICSRPRGTCKC